MSRPVGTICKKRDIKERLEKNTYHNPKTDCWEFLGTIGYNGYASIWYLGKMQRVNRLSAHLYLGLDLEDESQLACHKDDLCSNRRCWNPDHLYVGSHSDNRLDSMGVRKNERE
jgi:hypothetical protein